MKFDMPTTPDEDRALVAELGRRNAFLASVDAPLEPDVDAMIGAVLDAFVAQCVTDFNVERRRPFHDAVDVADDATLAAAAAPLKVDPPTISPLAGAKV